ncbi:DUF4928 family protein [Stenotrophomonas muris]|uniref:DUF4928 family protein n=1 Tax=Stenotrophomonas muris TaxID=2963283 RepID=A0ABU5MDH8_9GAMM|nr:DUF4928 family protein [Stenotrophomonas muris]MBN5038929.1 DUF4928 family protein [Stenotrophomonas maltophilia]MDZ7510831.1 DUF4928 family protein [Stenotrophomonas muris]
MNQVPAAATVAATFEEDLAAFSQTNKIRGKGALAVMLVINEHAKKAAASGALLNENDLLTEQGGQVLGLGRSAVQAILARHNITRVLAEEGGRTSRGSIGFMRLYVAFLNEQAAVRGSVNLDESEAFWIRRVEAFFAGKPFVMKLDSAWSIRTAVRYLTGQAEARQKEAGGTMFLGTMMQHLVGAKLQTVLPEEDKAKVIHHGSNQSDQKPDRHGDFDLEDVAIHVSTAPSESLIRKCGENLGKGKRPVIITTRKGLATAEGLLENAGLADRVDVVEFEQFIATNVFEFGRFTSEGRRDIFQRIVDAYNDVVDKHETDPSLRIEMTGGK